MKRIARQRCRTRENEMTRAQMGYSSDPGSTYLFENPLQVLAGLLEHLANAIWVVFVAMRNEPTPYMTVIFGDTMNIESPSANLVR